MARYLQGTQLDTLAADAQEMASQIQAMETMRQAEEEEEERTKRARIDAGKSPKNSSLTESLNSAANSIRDQRPETLMNTASKESAKNKREADRQGDHRRGIQWSDRNTHASRRD